MKPKVHSLAIETLRYDTVDTPVVLTTKHIYFGFEALSLIASSSGQSEAHAICEGAMSGLGNNYMPGCIIFEVWPYG